MFKEQSNSLQALDKEIALLREKLNQVGKEREEWFERKENLKRRIANLISQSKQVRDVRDKSSKEQLEFYKKRDELNSKVKELVNEYNKEYYERRKVLKEHNIKQDPDKLKRNIEYYETIIETEAITFKKEKKLMDYIRGLKKSLEETKVADNINSKMNNLSKQISEFKKQSNEYHKRGNEAYYKNKSTIKEFNLISKKITAFNKLQEKAFDNFVKLKDEYSNLSRQLKEKSKENFKEKEKTKQVKKAVENKKVNDEKKLIEDKMKQAEEKLRKGGKLTQDDLVAFQDKK
ncbi:MAG: hypothetical protein Q8R00_02840 [Candidatus Nanoarchaeia archaeon]|nr:hypothetical protein [Candidatus Nanoarchaeia archaeon]